MTGRTYIICLIVAVSLLALIGCGPNQRIIQSGNENPPANLFSGKVEPAVSSFERDIEAMRTAEFYFILVFRRKDRAIFDADDKQFLAANIPTEVNRRQLSDEGKALIVGTNFLIPDNMLNGLIERFDLEDLSPKKDDRPTNVNTAANAINGK